MAISVSSSQSTQAATGTSESFTVDATGCSALVVLQYAQNNVGLTATYNGVSFTQVVQEVFDGANTGFVLFNPTSGSHTLTVSWTNSTEHCTFVVALAGGATTGILNTDFAVGGNHGGGNTQSVTTTPIQTGSMLLAMYRCGDGTNACSTNMTELNSQASFGCRDGEYHTTTASTPVTQNGTHNNGSNWNMIAVEYALTGTAATAIKTVDGLAKASVKTVGGLAIASVKTVNGLA